jgi:hypothetical protein
LVDIEFADAVLAYETLQRLPLIGHTRAEVLTGGIVPVLMLDVSQDEADKLRAREGTVFRLTELPKMRHCGVESSASQQAV